MKQRLDSYCGMYCAAYPMPECPGCKTDSPNHHSPDCKFIKCARERNIEFCCECSDYPCEVLVAFNNDDYTHHSTALPNLNRILAKGLEIWLEEQRARWRRVARDWLEKRFSEGPKSPLWMYPER